MRTLSIAVFLTIATGCGPHSVDDLAQPTLELDIGENGLCQTEVVVDGNDTVWTEHGCEGDSSGWRSLGSIDAAARTELERLFDAAKSDAAPACGYTYRTEWAAKRGVGGAAGLWLTCKDTTLAPTPAQQAFVDAMIALTK